MVINSGIILVVSNGIIYVFLSNKLGYLFFYGPQFFSAEFKYIIPVAREIYYSYWSIKIANKILDAYKKLILNSNKICKV
jgi:hypothetical protein